MIYKAPGALTVWHISHVQNNFKLLAFSTPQRKEKRSGCTGDTTGRNLTGGIMMTTG